MRKPDDKSDAGTNINGAGNKSSVDIIGPAEAVIYKIDEVYRRVIYIKTDDEELTGKISDYLVSKLGSYENVAIQVDIRR